jgi:uncharacterized membrane protein
MVIEFLLKNEEFIIRLGYFLTALIILSVIVNKSFIITIEVITLIFFVLLIILMICNLVVFALLKKPAKIMYLIPLSLIITLIFSHYTFIRYFMVVYSTDSIIMSHVGAESILRGENPYKVSLLPHYERFNLPLQFSTPKIDGTFTDVITYPAFNFLFFVPFIFFGLNDIRWALLFSHIATLIVMYIFTPKQYRSLILIPMFIIPDFLTFTPGGVTDIVWVFLLVLSLKLWNSRPVISYIFIGLASSFKQIVWYALPFFSIRLWYEGIDLPYSEKVKRFAIFCTTVGLTFTVVNAPFVIDARDEWLQAVLAPLFPQGAPMVPFGFGLAFMSSFGISMPMRYFTGLTILAIVVATIAYYLYCDKYPWLMWVLLLVIPLFWWRSLPNYFIYWIPLLAFDFLRNYAKGENNEIVQHKEI